MPERDSGWVGGSVVDAEDARLATAALAAPASSPVQSRTGLRPAPGDPGLVRATGTPSGNVTVQPFQAVIQGTRHAGAGAYLTTLDEQKTLKVLDVPAHGSYSRIDLVVARQTDAQYGDTTSRFTVEVVAGTADPSPAEPVVPGDVLKLAQITVRANTSSITTADILDLRPYTCAVGGILPVRNADQRPVDAYNGLYVHRQDTGRLEFFNGSGWKSLVIEDDTGWQPLSLNPFVWLPQRPGVDEDGSGVHVRRIGQVVYLRGTATRRTTPAGHGAVIVTIPQAFRPPLAHHWVANTFTGHAPPANAHQFLDMSLQRNGEVALWTDNNVSVPVGETIYLNTSYLLG
ncbi:hypothetical protein LWC34_02910 [Kibdelosporangium philippinense]|uniref:Uncharacterized protein n=1 Tax=Kibdelosporangium philippinense TaxID=211113 RepID=A0ABS8Z4W5_9PSEU|nr:hypothetical protein [Kibdelosporangium philippinense]MCE7001795.1 hypothetical protein [Kibdelosporangium philippinense]